MTTLARQVGAQRVPVRVRQVDATNHLDLESLAAMHHELLSFGPVAQLGRRFLRDVCYGALLRDGLMEAAIAEVEGEAAGFIAFTPRSITFHRVGLSRHWMLSASTLGAALLSDPSLVRRVPPVIKLMTSRRSEKQHETDPIAEVTAIGVRPEFRGRESSQRTARHVGLELLAHAARRFAACGFTTFRAVVDSNNRPTLLFYGGLGADAIPCDRGGRRSIQFTIPVAEVLDDAPVDPPCWRQEEASRALPAGGWSDYWEGLSSGHGIFAAESDDYVRRLREAMTLSPEACVLDFGCGFGHSARALAPHVGQVGVWDAAANMRRIARLTLAQVPNIVFPDLTAPQSTRAGTWDMILVHSVVQYMSEGELQDWLVQWHRMLVPGGRLVISDVLGDEGTALAELPGMLRFAAARGMLLPVLHDGVAEFGRYRRQRESLPLRRLSPDRLQAQAGAAGLALHQLPANLSHRAGRRSFVLQPQELTRVT